ncbi:hypothetical protein BUALT_Bualt19G0011600 [Buddleja alternifolia]|uniref:Uncharacterized protein n=1 Tax=Buddleja alternifolia TaxID=168488 RepID=A0AAV6W6F5_9LAMI|nr:hypothetical protein BUALT_Bualt19G0011600 [Buddleja alternifolia]
MDMLLFAGFSPLQPYWSSGSDSRITVNKRGGEVAPAVISANFWKFYDTNKAAQNGGNPVPKESVFNRTHKRNEEKGPFVDKKSKRTLETCTKLKESRSQSSGNAMLSPQWSSTFIPEVWVEASGGLKNGRSYGCGKSYSGSFTSSGTIPSNNYSKSELEQLKEELREMKKEQQEINDKISQLLAFFRATYANFSGHHFSHGQYSSPQYSAPSPGQYSASARAGKYPPTGTTPYSAPTHSQYTATGSGQYPPLAPGYYPAPPLGYFMTPATQFHVPGNYVAQDQHPSVPTQQSDQLPSPG